MYAATNLKPSDYLPKPKSIAYQNGNAFYDAVTGKIVAAYPFIIVNGNDLHAAQRVRDRFLNDHPFYELGA